MSVRGTVRDELIDQAQICGRVLRDFRRDSRLVEDLGYDDIDLMDIGFALQRKLKIRLPLPLMVKTTGELIDLCRRLVAAKEAAHG